MIFSQWILALLENWIYLIELKYESSFCIHFQGVESTRVYFPDAEWYEYDTVRKCRGYYGILHHFLNRNVMK